MQYRIRSEPFAYLNALADAHHGNLLYGIGRELVVAKVAENLPVDGIACVTRGIPPEVAGQVETREGLGEKHLPTAEHAAPATVRVWATAAYWTKTLAIGEPNATLNVFDKLFLVLKRTRIIVSLNNTYTITNRLTVFLAE